MLRELLNIVEEKYGFWLTPGDGLLYSLMGMAVVFFGLILLMIVIKIIGAVQKRSAGNEADETPAAQTAPAAAPAAPAPGSAGELKLYDTPDRDAAMVMAIVADKMGKPVNEIRFISIREVKEDEV